MCNLIPQNLQKKTPSSKAGQNNNPEQLIQKNITCCFEQAIKLRNWENYLKQVNNSYVTSINNYYQRFTLFKSEKFIINNEDRNIGIFQICFIAIGKLIFIRLNLGPCFFPNISENIKKINNLLKGFFAMKLGKKTEESPEEKKDEE